jgi:transmembrane 9 superfamily protein 2/4
VQEDVQEDWGWKLVHGEVFRTPTNPLVLSALVGNGAQISAMVGVTLSVSILPLINAPNTKLRSSSLCSTGVPFALEPRLSRHGNDDLLDFLWQVCLQIWVCGFAKLTVVYSISGYTSSRVYASLGGAERRKNAFVTATVLPT